MARLSAVMWDDDQGESSGLLSRPAEVELEYPRYSYQDPGYKYTSGRASEEKPEARPSTSSAKNQPRLRFSPVCLGFVTIVLLAFLAFGLW